MGNPYVMAPLSQDASTPQFRLLELHPRTPSSLITCSLRTYSLDDRCPAYKALSYTWEPKEKPHSILLNGIEFYIGRSLWTFLKQTCLQGQYGVYWIDAVCINQDNILEKNHQVQMMRRIYSTAERVAIWLGEANEDEMSDRAMDSLSQLGLWVLLDIYHADDEFLSIQYGEYLSAVTSLFLREYWSRIWIIQGTMVAKSILVYCGAKSLEWQALVAFMYFCGQRP